MQTTLSRFLTVLLAFAASPAFVAATEPPPSMATPAPTTDHPPVFTDLDFDPALAKTKGTDRILIVKFTAIWCGPCKMMDKTTWRDDKVVEWVKANGLAIAVDVDRQAKIAKDNDIEAMPTMVAFKDGAEFDRVVGYRGATDLLNWMEDVKAGKKTPVQKLSRPERTEAKAPPDGVNMQERLSRAERLATKKDTYAEATKEFVWLWKHMLEYEEAMYGVRLSFMAGAMKGLAMKSPEAKETFTALRDETESRLKSKDKTFEDLSDWVELNGMVRDEDRTLAWFDRIKNDADAGSTLEREGFRLEQLLTQRQRWADLALIYPDSVSQLDEKHSYLQMTLAHNSRIDEGHRADVDRIQHESFRKETGTMYASMLAAGRADDAAKVQAEAIKLDDTAEMRMALVEKAIEAGRPRESQASLLDEAAGKGGAVDDLRGQLKAALAAKK